MAHNKQQKVVKFDENLRQKIIDGLEKRDLGIDEPVTLIDGFINQPLNMEVSGDLIIGGSVIPTILLVGDKSGRLYSFALNAILKDLDMPAFSVLHHN